MINNKVVNWINKRFPVNQEVFEELAAEPIPNHLKRWFYCLGGTPLVLFFIQVATGLMLSLYYVPTPDHAFQSVTHITEDISFGWWIRGIHHWGAHLMILAVFLHMLRVFFTGAYRAPRELNWMIGIGLLLTTLVIGFTGYSLVYNQLSYWALIVGTNLANEVPVIGKLLLYFGRGGPMINPNTLTRMYTLHFAALPVVLIAFITLHVYLIRTLGVSKLPEDEETPKDIGTYPFFPDHMFSEIILFMIIILVLTELAILFPPHIGMMADPLTTPPHIKPEWYFYAVFRYLKLVPLTFGIISSGVFVVLLVLFPFYEPFIRKLSKKHDVPLYLGIVAGIIFCFLTVYEAMN